MTEWPMVPLGDILTKSEEWITLEPDKEYKEVTVRLWGKGVSLRREVKGVEIASQRRLVVQENQFILSRIDARNGAFGLIPKSLEGAIVSNDFPVFNLEPAQIDPFFLSWMSKTNKFIDICIAASEGTTNRVRLQEDRFLATSIPLPPLPEQQRIVERIEALATKIKEAQCIRLENETSQNHLLLSAYHRISKDAVRKPMSEVAPLHRRLADIDIDAEYPQIAVRSFGKGTFHKPALLGSEITWQKPYLVKAGDILISNIKAWEGAIAVAETEDDGFYGSHRYLTCVPHNGIATSRFVCFHLLTPQGLHDVGEASPGSADRNRTLNTKTLLDILIPVPSYKKQIWFNELYEKVGHLKKFESESTTALNALLPSILAKAFKGEL